MSAQAVHPGGGRPAVGPGPLEVSAANPRYFTIRSGDAAGQQLVYLTGAHVWNNFHDGLGPGRDCARTPERNDYSAYLNFLAIHGHNFIRLWRWEHFVSTVPGFHLCMTPQPWPRTGPGLASDRKPRFDLSAFDRAYFDRLRHRIITAGEREIYVSVMLFEGFGLHLSESPNNLAGHPFAEGNNTNGIGIRSPGDYQSLEAHSSVIELQKAYIREVVDSVADLPNVLYEVANEAWTGSVGWQYWVITYLKQYETAMGYGSRPVGMTFVYPDPDKNAALFQGPADWVSPGYEERYRDDPWLLDPPANDGTKVVLSDTDHYAAGEGDAVWAWKTFLRGHNPLLMDFGIVDVLTPLESGPGVPSYDRFEPARCAMGDTLRYARAVPLITMEPHGELSSTRYALAAPGNEYLILQPADPPRPFGVTLAPDTYTATWYSLGARSTKDAGTVTVRGSQAATNFAAPFETGAAVLHLWRAEPTAARNAGGTRYTPGQQE